MAYLSIDVDIQKNNNGINIEDLKSYLKSLTSNNLFVGVHADAGQENVKKMLWNEFGTNHYAKHDYNFESHGIKDNFIHEGTDIRIPARPVVRMYLYSEMKNEICIEYQLALNSEKTTKLKKPTSSAMVTLNRLGQECVFMQRNKMANGSFSQIDTKGKDTESNRGLTIKLKGFNHPYFDTGELISKIDYKIRKKGN